MAPTAPSPSAYAPSTSVSSRFSHTEIRPHDEERDDRWNGPIPGGCRCLGRGGVSPGHVTSTSGYLRYLSPRIFFHTGCDCPYPEGL